MTTVQLFLYEISTASGLTYFIIVSLGIFSSNTVYSNLVDVGIFTDDLQAVLFQSFLTSAGRIQQLFGALQLTIVTLADGENTPYQV